MDKHFNKQTNFGTGHRSNSRQRLITLAILGLFGLMLLNSKAFLSLAHADSASDLSQLPGTWGTTIEWDDHQKKFVLITSPCLSSDNESPLDRFNEQLQDGENYKRQVEERGSLSFVIRWRKPLYKVPKRTKQNQYNPQENANFRTSCDEYEDSLEGSDPRNPNRQGLPDDQQFNLSEISPQ